MIATVPSATLHGLEVLPVEVEISLSRGTPMIQVVGLAQSAIREGRARVRAAARSVGHRVPGMRVTVNLAPADVPKPGSAFDLPITVGILAAWEKIPAARASRYAMMGELGLNGEVRPVRGVLPVALELERRRRAGEPGPWGLIVPAANLAEAAPATSLDVRGAEHLRDVLAFLSGDDVLRAAERDVVPRETPGKDPDLADVAGQEGVKRALEVAAAGGHHLLLRGSPGGGKTMLARRAATVLPDLDDGAAVEVTAVHSVAGTLAHGAGLLTRPPFRAPHHTVTRAGLAGGGFVPRPGEISLAHRGVLFLDEVTEFRRAVLEVLRQPLEEGWIGIVRSKFSARYPARFMLVAAMNPCPCGHAGDGAERCTCDPGDVRRYLGRLSGPLMDRIDLRVDVPSLGWKELEEAGRGEPSARVRERVTAARRRARLRLRRELGYDDAPAARWEDGGNGGIGTASPRSNAEIPTRDLSRLCRLDPAGEAMMERAADGLGLSARGCHRVLRVARTVADLAGHDRIGRHDVAEALRYRR